MEGITFNLKVLKSTFISNPLKKIDFTFEQLFYCAESLIKEELHSYKKNQRILLISSDVYFIISFILSCWNKNVIPAIISPNLYIEDYNSLFERITFDHIITDIENIHDTFESTLIKFNTHIIKNSSGPIEFIFEPDQTAIVLFSSGSSGNQKAIPLSFLNILTNVNSFKETLVLTEEVSFLCTSPVWHAHGLYNSIITSFFLQKKVIYSGILNLFNATKLLEFSQKEPELVYHLTPSMIPILCSVAAKMNQKKLPKFSRVICGTSFLDDKTKTNFENKFNAELIQQYGMTEVLFISFNDKPKIKVRSVGKPLAMVDLDSGDKKVLAANQEGQIRIKSPSFYGCYLDESPIKNTPADDFFFTGDIGYLDDEGYLFITGREKDIIKKGGLAVSPNKINKIIEGFEGVTKAYTLSQLDQNVGEEIFSFITASHNINLSNLKDYLKTRLSIKIIPKEIFQIKKFPLNEMGKISKKDLFNILKS